MCIDCFNIEYFKFPTSNEFDYFDQEFSLKINASKLLLTDKNVEYKGDFHSVYMCKTCKTTWWYSMPENAWRGYFLHENNAKIHIDKYKKQDRIKGYVGMTILIILIAALLKAFI